MQRKSLLSLLVLLMISTAAAFGQCLSEPGRTLVFVPVGDIAVNTLWTNNNVYVLQGPTYVVSGVTLTIEPGTVIKGITGLPPGSVAALVVERGGKIIADGTAAQPIIWTACTDDVSNPNDLGRSDRGLWGSLIILGRAPINGTVTPPEICPTALIEGLPPSAKHTYGGCDPTDNSGIIRYNQFKHGGSIIGAANEINGLTLGGVGSGTTIEYVEVFANLDDGFEWFGGNVNCKYLVSAFNDDDDFDWDQGYHGKLQFLFAIKDSTNGDRLFESDGDDGNADTDPTARPVVYNVTSIGRGQLPSSPSNANAAFHFKENSGGHIRNAIVVDWPRNGVFMEDQSSPSFSLTYPDCAILTQKDVEYRSRCWTGSYNTNFSPAAPAYANPIFAGGAGIGSDLTMYGVIFWNIGRNAKLLPNELTAGQSWTEKRLFTDYPALAVSLTGQSWRNVIDNPLLYGTDFARCRFAGQNALDPRPAPNSPAFTEARTDAPAEDAFFSSAPYAGAFDATNNWLCGWTNIDDQNYLRPCAPRVTTCLDETGKTTISVPAGDINRNVNWTNENIYVLQGPVYVTDSARITIEQGTIIKGVTGLPPGSVATLTIERNAQIYALGDSCCPIVFTAQTDNVNNANDLTRSDRGLWGSLIVLGNAPINGTVTPPNLCATNFIEGLTPSPKTEYGGCDAFDNSGVIKWIQLKHGGSIIGAANEINGLTLGGVGSGTEVHHVEVFANLDDGYEWFGGTVNCRYLVSAFNDDDDFDWDQGYSGKLQFLFSIKDSTNGDRAFESDGDDGNVDTEPYSRPIVYNVTSFGRGEVFATAPSNEDAALKFKENSGGHIRNSIFYEWPRGGVDIEDQSSPSFSLAAIPDCAVLTQIDCEYHSRCETATFTNPNWVGGYSNTNAAYANSNLSIYGTLWCAINAAAITPSIVARSQSYTEQRLFTDYPSIGGSLAGVAGGKWDNRISDPVFKGNKRNLSRFAGNNALDPRPAAGEAAFTLPIKDAPAEDSWFYSAPYAGAFNATNNWMLCWTALWQADYLNENAPAACSGKCGDVDGNGAWSIADAVYMINYIFAGGSAPCSTRNGDADGNGALSIADAVYLINYIFAGGSAPACPCV